MTSILINDDLLLRSFQPDDAADLFACVDGARAELRPWLNWVDATTKPEQSLEFIQMATAWQHSGEGLALGIFLQKSRQFIGTIGMSHYQRDQKRAQIGYWLDPHFQGQGYMFRSAVRFVDFLFSKLNLNKIEMHMIPSNQRSIALAARLGAVVEGQIRQSYCSSGSFHDVIITGILRSEWDARKFIS